MPAVRCRKNNKIDNHTRERIVDLVVEHGHTPSTVAHNFNIPPSTVRAIVKTFLECDGRVAKLPRGGNRRSRIEMVHVDFLIEKMDEFAALTVQQLTDELNVCFEIQPPPRQKHCK